MTNDSRSMEFQVTETFFSLNVRDMDRATKFYSRSLGAVITWASPRWSSLHIAGVRVGLLSNERHSGGQAGLLFAVTDLEAACACVQRGGGRVVNPAMQVAPMVFVAEVSDTEGNIFGLQQDSAAQQSVAADR